MVCQLIQSPYGLKLAPAVWNKPLHDFLQKIGFKRLDSAYPLYSLYEDGDGDGVMLLAVYADDLLSMGPSDLCDRVAARLEGQYTLQVWVRWNFYWE